MEKLNPWIHGAVFSITAVINYALCTIFWFAFTEPSIKLLNALFHGMDFRKIYTVTTFSPGDVPYVLIIFAVWAYILGVIYATVRNLLIARNGA